PKKFLKKFLFGKRICSIITYINSRNKIRSFMKTDFSLWTRYFRSNVHHAAAIRFAPLPELSLSEKRRIQHSLARFQSGQNSDGKTHRKKIVSLGNPELLQACRYFIREEVDHSMLLAQFMRQENIPLKTHD